MSFLKKIDEDLIVALKAGDKEKVTVLRSLKSDLKYKKIEKGDDLTEDDSLTVFNSSVKKIKDSIEQFKAGNRDDLVAKEEFALNIIQEYLPEQLSEEDLIEFVKQAIEESGADSPQKIGLVMKAVMPKVKGRADGKLINQIAVKLLS
jgi:uncharacterized protein YqeY